MAHGGSGSRGQVAEMIKPLKEFEQCTKHKDERLKSYCEDCQQLICIDCYVLLTELKSKTSSVLQGRLGGATMTGNLSQLAAVVQQAEAQIQDSGYIDNVVVDAKQFDELKGFVQGKAKKAPSNLKFPQPQKFFVHNGKTLKAVPRDVGQQLASHLGVQHPTICVMAGPNNLQGVLTSGGRWSHAYANLYKQPGNDVTCYWIPASLSISEAVRQATGTTPRRVTPYEQDHDVMLHQTVQQWFSSTEDNDLKYTGHSNY